MGRHNQILFGASAIIALATAGQASAQARSFDLPAQPAHSAVGELGRQGGVQVIAARKLTRDRRTSAVQGIMTVDQAFARLLNGTGLVARQIAPKTYSIIQEARSPAASLTRASTRLAGLVQDTSPAAVTPPPAPRRAPVAATEANTQDIIVTGSRVVQNGNASATPVTVVATSRLQDIRPGTIADNLASIPVFSGSRGQTAFGQGTGGSGGGNAVANVLNLRNIGLNRNLVLMDGRRVPPTTGFNTVDIDTVPQMLLQRIDVVTGGVSAVYGSDAVSGVVNFITDKTLQGVKAQAYHGISMYGDAPVYDVGVAGGTRFADGRGHIEASYEFRDDRGLLSRYSRPWFSGAVIAGAGTPSFPYQIVTGGRQANLPFGGRINCGATCSLNSQYFATDGVLRPFDNGQPVVINGTTVAGLQVGGAGGNYDSSLRAPQRSHQFFGRLDYDLTDNVKAFAYGSANIKQNQTYVDWLSLANVSLSSTNPFLAPAYQTALLAAGPTFTFSRLINQEDTRIGYLAKSRQLIGVAGLTGDLRGIKWDATFNHGDALLRTTVTNDVNQQRLAASLDAVRQGANIVCGINGDALTSNDDPSCVPLNPFGPTASSSAALDYILGETHYRLHTVMNDVVVNASGSPFSTWAGPIHVGVTGEWRRLSVSATSDYTPANLANCAGIPRNCGSSTLLFIQSFSNWPEVRQSVAEAGAEIDLPLLKDVPFAQDLRLNGAVRYTDYYDSVGSYWTWKLGGSWQVNDDLRLRGTISSDIRAPTLNDLYAPLQTNFSGSQPDLLTNVSPNPVIRQDQFGNANLKAEIGKTKTIGFVWKPSFIPGFSAAVDYYDIEMTDAILTIIGSSSNLQNACYDSGGSSIYCTLQERPGGFSRTPANTAASNAWTRFITYPLNIGKITTYGVDFELNYATRLMDRALNLRLLTAWQPHIRYYQEALPTIDQGGVAFGNAGISAAPKWRLTGIVSYNVTPEFRIDVQERWRSKLIYWGDPNAVWAGSQVIRSFAQTALNMSYTLPIGDKKSFELFANIQNLFNAAPPPANGTGTGAQPGRNNGWVGEDDPIGRYYTVGVRMKL